MFCAGQLMIPESILAAPIVSIPMAITNSGSSDATTSTAEPAIVDTYETSGGAAEPQPPPSPPSNSGTGSGGENSGGGSGKPKRGKEAGSSAIVALLSDMIPTGAAENVERGLLRPTTINTNRIEEMFQRAGLLGPDGRIIEDGGRKEWFALMDDVRRRGLKLAEVARAMTGRFSLTIEQPPSDFEHDAEGMQWLNNTWWSTPNVILEGYNFVSALPVPAGVIDVSGGSVVPDHSEKHHRLAIIYRVIFGRIHLPFWVDHALDRLRLWPELTVEDDRLFAALGVAIELLRDEPLPIHKLLLRRSTRDDLAADEDARLLEPAIDLMETLDAVEVLLGREAWTNGSFAQMLMRGTPPWRNLPLMKMPVPKAEIRRWNAVNFTVDHPKRNFSYWQAERNPNALYKLQRLLRKVMWGEDNALARAFKKRLFDGSYPMPEFETGSVEGAHADYFPPSADGTQAALTLKLGFEASAGGISLGNVRLHEMMLKFQLANDGVDNRINVAVEILRGNHDKFVSGAYANDARRFLSWFSRAWNLPLELVSTVETKEDELLPEGKGEDPEDSLPNGGDQGLLPE